MSTALDAIRGTEEGVIEHAPFMQVINGNTAAAKDFGLFILETEAKKIDFQPRAGWKEHEKYFGSNTEPSKGYICQKPRLLLVRSGPLSMYTVEGEYLGVYDHEIRQNLNPILKTRYLVYILDENNKPLHNKPVTFTAKGAFGGSFGSSYKQFKTDVEAVLNQRRTGEFWAYCVFEFEIKPVQKGKAPSMAWVSSVQNVTKPTVDNMSYLFVGLDKDLKAQIKEAYESNPNFGHYTVEEQNQDQSAEGIANTLSKAERKPKNEADIEALKERIKVEVLLPEEESNEIVDVEKIPF